MFLGAITLFIAILISGVSAYYSILGLTAIFAAAPLPVIVMGCALEAGKVMTAVWLHRNWQRANLLFKIYLVPAIMFLMFLTSIGVFGFLSKAHLDQAIPSADIQAQVQLLNEKIQTQRENIELARKTLDQLNATVDETIARSKTERGAANAVLMRKNQNKERASLQNTISLAQAEIISLQEQRASLAVQVRKADAEVGPIKYVSALIYGDDADSSSLERAVRWVILLIVVVFDPLAIMLIIAGIKQIEWTKTENKQQSETTSSDSEEKINNDANNLYLAGIDGNTYGVVPMYIKPDQEQQNESVEDIKQPPQHDLELLAELDHQREHIEATENILASLSNDYQQLEEQHNISLSRNLTLQEKIDKLEQQLVETRSEVDTDVWYAARAENYAAHAENLAEQLKNLLDENTKLQNERDLLFSAHSHELIRADQLAVELENYLRKDMEVEQQDQTNSAPIEAVNPAIIEKPQSEFGLEFPTSPKRGDMFMRVDFVPSRLFKWNGVKWIEVNKNTTDVYAYNQLYIQFLTDKLNNGEYSFDDLSEIEQQQVQQNNH